MTSREFGSDFHYQFHHTVAESFVNQEGVSLFFSGRVALYNLLSFGINTYGWRLVGFPSYYCHEVVDFCRQLPIEVIYYTYNPHDDNHLIEWDDQKDTVFINVDFFGSRKPDVSFLKRTTIIEDVTHNLLSSSESLADYCFGSLRKQLPVATGGFCYSKKGDFAPSIPERRFANALAMQKLSAMWLKAEYLKGSFSHKEIYRQLFLNAEAGFDSIQTNAALPGIIQAQLRTLSPARLIVQTHSNVSRAIKSLNNIAKSHLLNVYSETAMGLVLILADTEQRNHLKTTLIENNIYPAVLWPRQFSNADLNLQDRILFVHVDFRYTDNDINFITNVINHFFNNA